MKNYKPIMSFGENVFDVIDVDDRGDEAATVRFLKELAHGGPVLELAIGSGRIAVPLAAEGISVDGIDISESMVARMRTKEGGDKISVTMGDFADVPVPGTYALVYLVFNTLFNLLTQDDQVRCFENVAMHLTDGGLFVVEAFVPAYLYQLRDNQYVDAEAIGIDRVRLDVGRHDPVRQMLDESHVLLSRDGVGLAPIVTRYAWPAELDLMARIAGLRLKERWGGWNLETFDAASRQHVSVYGR